MFSKTRTADSTEEAIQRFLRQGGYRSPTPFQKKVFPLLLQDKDALVETGELKGKTAGFLIPLFLLLGNGTEETAVLILTDSPGQAQRVDHELKRLFSRKLGTPSYAVLGCSDSIKKELPQLAKKPAIIVGTSERIIDHLRRENISLDCITHVVTAPEENGNPGFLADLQFIYTKLSRRIVSFMFVKTIEYPHPWEEFLKRPTVLSLGDWYAEENPPERQNRTVKIPEEKSQMKNKAKQSEESTARIEKKLEAIMKAIREEENADILNTYKRIIRKKVPLTLRQYVGAYLLRYSTIETESVKAEKPTDTKTLFVNVGKNRRVFPKDLSKLFSATLGIEPREIGSIKVLDNYSFLEIPTPLAQKAIDLLDGKEFRGKKIAVNFSRKKEEPNPAS